MKKELIPFLEYGHAETQFGVAYIVFLNDEIYSLIFAKDLSEAINDIQKRFSGTDLHENTVTAEMILKNIFENNIDYQLHLVGTDFQMKVWKALQQIPYGGISTYSKIAETIGEPKAVRAVGTAIGANPIAYIIPCHRVLRSDGGLGGYRWGVEIKNKMLEFEKLK